MDIKISHNFSSTNFPIFKFLLSIKDVNFSFQESNNSQSPQERNVFYVAKPLTSYSELKREILKFNERENIAVFFLPSFFGNKKMSPKINTILYPIKIDLFLNKLFNAYFQNIKISSDVSLTNDNLLINTINNKKVYLTEIESKIIIFLANNKLANKSLINNKVLGQKTIIDSKTLESHLYRLRNKLQQIQSTIKIITDEKKLIKLTNLNLKEGAQD